MTELAKEQGVMLVEEFLQRNAADNACLARAVCQFGARKWMRKEEEEKDKEIHTIGDGIEAITVRRGVVVDVVDVVVVMIVDIT